MLRFAHEDEAMFIVQATEAQSRDLRLSQLRREVLRAFLRQQSWKRSDVRRLSHEEALLIVPFTKGHTMQIDFNPSNENAFGVAMLAGRVVGTVQGSDGHIVVRATCKAKSEGGRWNTVPFEKATHVFFDVPSAEGEWADKIGTYYPQGTGMKWAGHFFEDRSQTDSRRIAAAKYLMRTIAGEIDGKHVLKSERCARCSKELTHPDSIFAMFGPECVKKVAAYMPNRSGTPEGAHSKKIADHTPDAEPAPSSRRAEDTQTSTVEAAAAFERHHGAEDDRTPGLEAWARANREFQRPTPDVSRERVNRVEKSDAPVERDGLTIVLRKGDDPKVVLKALDA